MMKRTFAAAMLLIALVACGSTVSDSGSGVEGSAVSVADTSTTAEVEEPGLEASQPILTVFAVCYSICAPTYAMPQFAVYGDERLVVIDRADPENLTSEYRGRSFVLSPEDVESMRDLISDGGLTGGGIHAAGTREGVADGGGFVFESQIGDETAYVHAPFLDEPDRGTRGALFDLLTLFRSYTDTDGVDIPLKWVMVGQTYPEPGATPWKRDERPQGSPPCLAFDPEDLGDVGAELTSQEFYESKWIIRRSLPRHAGQAPASRRERLRGRPRTSPPSGGQRRHTQPRRSRMTVFSYSDRRSEKCRSLAVCELGDIARARATRAFSMLDLTGPESHP